MIKNLNNPKSEANVVHAKLPTRNDLVQMGTSAAFIQVNTCLHQPIRGAHTVLKIWRLITPRNRFCCKTNKIQLGKDGTSLQIREMELHFSVIIVLLFADKRKLFLVHLYHGVPQSRLNLSCAKHFPRLLQFIRPGLAIKIYYVYRRNMVQMVHNYKRVAKG